MRLQRGATSFSGRLFPKLRLIGVGADADIAIWDPEATRTISVKTHHQKVDYNIFEGMTVKGVPSYTLSLGKIVWANGKLDVVEGSGRYVDRANWKIIRVG